MKLSRRRALRGMFAGAGVSLALPRLDAMLNGNGTAYAAGAPLPRRFGVWTWANGVHLKRWVPVETGAGYSLPDELTPLAGVKDAMTVVSGTRVPFGPGRGHAAPNTHLMTGAPTVPPSSGGSTQTAKSASIDQLIAAAIARKPGLKSLEVGVDRNEAPERGTSFHWWSHRGSAASRGA